MGSSFVSLTTFWTTGMGLRGLHCWPNCCGGSVQYQQALQWLKTQAAWKNRSSVLPCEQMERRCRVDKQGALSDWLGLQPLLSEA